MKTVLVTGGCGFIGSHFVRLALQHRDWRLVNLDWLTYAGGLENLACVEESDRYRFVHGDIASRELVDDLIRGERPWAIVNFGAESHVDRSILDSSPFLHTNVLGVQVLLEAARQHGVDRFVQISTDEVYGDAEGKQAFGEDSPLTPSSPYAASKAAADLLCLAYRRTHGVPVLIVRSSNNYGPNQFPEKLIPLTIRNALSGAELPVYGDGLQHRDWLYVEDNCWAIKAVLERGEVGRIYNVAAGEEKPNLEVVREVCLLVSQEAGIDQESLLGRIRFVADRPGHDRRYAVNAQTVRRELQWAPRMPFEVGLRITVRWYLDHQSWLKRATADAYRQYYEAVYTRRWERTE